MRLVDAHVHVELRSPELGIQVAEELGRLDMGMFHCGLNPRSWEGDMRALGNMPHVCVGAGLHPWWVKAEAPDIVQPSGDVSCGEPEAQLLERLCWQTRFIGEIGLDFGKKTPDWVRPYQMDYFERICMAAAAASREMGAPRMLSIHAVRAADCVLDALERSGALDACHCIFHWFSGSSDELHRAVRAGCWFSMNTMGLKTGKGREYAKLIPSNRLLTETDQEILLQQPEQLAFLGELRNSLEHAIELLAEVRTTEVDEMRALTAANAEQLLWS